MLIRIVAFAALFSLACGSSTSPADAGPLDGGCPGPIIVCGGALDGAIQEPIVECGGMDAGYAFFKNSTGNGRSFDFRGHSASASFDGRYYSTAFEGISFQATLDVDGGGHYVADAGTVAFSGGCCDCAVGPLCKSSACSYHGTLDFQVLLDGGPAAPGIGVHLTF